jgi:hypothetical protein
MKGEKRVKSNRRMYRVQLKGEEVADLKRRLRPKL